MTPPPKGRPTMTRGQTRIVGTKDRLRGASTTSSKG